MAGIDNEYNGEAKLSDGSKVGYLPQEPELNHRVNVFENVMEGVAEKQAVLDRYNELAMNYSDDTADEMAKLQDEIDGKNLPCSIPPTKAIHSTIPVILPPPSANLLSHCHPY